MPRFAVAFMTPSNSGQLIHRIIEGENRDSVLKAFFTESASEFYSNDEQGFHYFKEDFFDESTPSGSIIELQ
ncbi:MAG: hypothetical protein JXA18_15785 [Chitinispirillaceae bacterium]|nr:hypothetical protein [Chitinispirillaceae bacterium]